MIYLCEKRNGLRFCEKKNNEIFFFGAVASTLILMLCPVSCPANAFIGCLPGKATRQVSSDLMPKIYGDLIHPIRAGFALIHYAHKSKSW